MDSSLSNPSSAGETELSTEIQSSEILPRLPAESLMRFRQVCKSWRSLIREPSFVKAHYRHFPLRQDHTHLFLTTSSRNSEPCQHFFSLQINRKGQLTLPTHILTLPASNFSFLRGTHSVNGLILLSEPRSQSEHVHIVNPCTREVITLPHASTCDKVVHRLGFSELTNEYKVLQVHKIVHKTGTKLKLNIFSLGSTRLWRDLHLDHLPFNPKSLNFSRRSVWLRGGIHWMHEDENVIVVFDFRDDRFRVIPFPIHAGNYPSLELIEVNGYVAVFEVGSIIENTMGLWILEDYENQIWGVKKGLRFNFSWRNAGSPSLLGTIHTGDLVLSDSNSKVYLYNMESERWGSMSSIRLPDRVALSSLLTSYGNHSTINMKYSVHR